MILIDRSAGLRNFLLLGLVGLFVYGAGLHPAQAQEVVPRVELWTMGQGEDPFERFGHGALCVYEGDDDPGRCYNYGTTNFRDPVGLVLDFLQGRSRFWVSVDSGTRTLELYQANDRTIWIQALPLTDAQA